MSCSQWCRLLLLAFFARHVATEWRLHETTNCWDKAGGTSMPGANPVPEAVSWDDCKMMCEADAQCGGVVVQRSTTTGRCFMRKDINVAACQHHDDYNLWELTARERLAGDLSMGGGMGEEAPPVKPPALSLSVSTPPRNVFKNAEAGYHTYRIPALVSVGGNEVLAFIEGRTGGGDNGRIDVVMKRSSDGGVNWGPAVTVVKSDGDIARGNPTPVYDEQKGRLLLIFCYNNKFVFVQSSDDKGATWSPPRNISSMVKRPGWGWVATGPGHAIQLKAGEHAGRIVVPFNTFFADALVKTVVHQRGCSKTDECAQYFDSSERSLDAMVEITNPLDPTMGTLRSKWYNDTTEIPPFVWNGDRSGVFYSDDGGDSWKLGGMVDSRLGSSECMAAESDKGLLLSFRVEDADTGCRKMALSNFCLAPQWQIEVGYSLKLDLAFPCRTCAVKGFPTSRPHLVSLILCTIQVGADETNSVDE